MEVKGGKQGRGRMVAGRSLALRRSRSGASTCSAPALFVKAAFRPAGVTTSTSQSVAAFITAAASDLPSRVGGGEEGAGLVVRRRPDGARAGQLAAYPSLRRTTRPPFGPLYLKSESSAPGVHERDARA